MSARLRSLLALGYNNEEEVAAQVYDSHDAVAFGRSAGEGLVLLYFLAVDYASLLLNIQDPHSISFVEGSNLPIKHLNTLLRVPDFKPVDIL